MAKRIRKAGKRQHQKKSNSKSQRTNQAAVSKNDKPLREHLLSLLGGENAHVNFDQAILDLPLELSGLKPEGIPYTAWQILEHLRIAQWDILEFSRNPKHVSPEWPKGYWPASDAPADEATWQGSASAFRADLKAMKSLVKNPKTDLYSKIPHGQGQTILREALVVADHNAYHIGQLVLLRRLLGAWENH